MKAAVFWLACVALAAALCPFLLLEAAQRVDTQHLLEAPSFYHWFGTDALGRDLLARVLCGASVSLGIGLGATTITMVLGVILGAAAGYWGGWRDRWLMGFIDLLLCFPTFFLILAVIAILGPSIFNVVLILGLTGWMGPARMIRAEVLSLREREFVLASKTLGGNSGWIIFRHLIPNVTGTVIVSAVMGVSAAIMSEAGLSFLGIGVQPPTPSWGNMLMEGKATLGAAWWLLFFPGVFIFLTVLSANVLGERLKK